MFGRSQNFNDLRSPGRVAADKVTSARAGSDSLDHDSRVPGVLQRHPAYPCLRYTSDELLSFDGQYVCSAQLAERIHQLGLAPGDHRCRRPARKRPYRVVVASRAGLSPSSSATGRHPSPGPSALSLH